MKSFHRRLLMLTTGAAAALTLALGISTSAAAPAPPSAEASRHVAATVDGEQYSVQISAPTVAVGADAQFQVKISAKPGFKFNKQFPTKLKLDEPPTGLEFPKRRLKKGDGSVAADSMSFTFPVPVKATQAGTFPFGGVLKFSVCNDAKCVVKREKLKSQIVAQ